MMDFNLILLLVGLGLLAVVILFALWGFLGGLKRELACIGVFAVLLVLAWLIFGNSGVLLNYNGGLVDSLRDMLNLPAKDATLWESVLDYLRSLEGLNLDQLLVEGKETYNLIYNIVSAVATLALLIVATLAVVIITPIIRLISHIVLLIIRGVKKRKAKKQGEPVEDEHDEENDDQKTDEEAKDAVLVIKGKDGNGDAVVTLSENELPAPKKTKRRIWGAVAGALKGVLLIILLFVPISGIYSIARVATPDTRELISDLVNGDTQKTTVAEQEGPADLAFEFVDAYEQSGIGKFVEGSSYFFGQSLSTLLFDSISTINTTNESIKLREELSVFIEAVNKLNGNLEIGTWTDEEIANALNMLKDSKLLPEAMPAVIEFVSVMDSVKEMLEKAPGQTVAFAKLRDIDWDADLETILDAVAVAYTLDIFPLEDFNYLEMDPEILAEVVSILGETEFIQDVFPIIIRVAVKLDAVEKITGPFNQKLILETINWKEELLNIVDIYETFQEYGYESLDELTKAELEDLVEHLVVDNFDTTVDILDQLVEMQIFGSTLVPVLQAAVNNLVATEYTEFANIINLNQLTVEEWKDDFKTIVEVAKLATTELNALSLKLEEMDIESPEAIAAMKEIVTKVFDLNVLGNDSTKNALVMGVFKKFDLFNEEDLYYQKGNENVSILDGINWKKEGKNLGEVDVLLNLIDVYGDFVKLDNVDIKNFKFDASMLEDDATIDVLVDALETLVDSEIVIAIIDPAVNKYVLPITNEYDDDNLIKDITSNIGSETVAQEIINIVKAFKDANKLGLFEVPEEGLAALNYTEVDAMKNIINVIFDSKLFEGYEGRIIRIIFKATKLLDIEKGLLNDINYDGEQEKLIAFIDEVTPILLDPEFKLTNDEGNVQLDLNYLTQQDVSTRLLDAVAIILGTYERQPDGSTVEVKGSILVETLLPSIYEKYLKDLIPGDIRGLVDILNIEELPADELASDVRRLVYIAKQLTLLDAQGLLVGDSVNFVAGLDYIYNIIDALYGIKMFAGHGNELFAWIVNYASRKFAGGLNIEEVTPEDFENVNWGKEGETGKALINKLVIFLRDNNLSTTEDITNFLNDKGYTKPEFVTVENANNLLDIISTALDLQTIDSVLPVVFQAVMNNLEKQENSPIKNFWKDGITSEELVSDLRSILEIGTTVVNETDLITWVQEEFKGEMVFPKAEVINSVLDQLFALNLVKGHEAELLSSILEKVLPTTLPFTVEDLNVESVSNWTNEINALEELITKVLEVLNENGYTTVQSITKGVFDDVTIVKLITDRNVNHVAEILDIATKLTLVQNILPAVFVETVVPAINNAGVNVDFLNDLTKEELTSDVQVVADILRTMTELGFAGFFEVLEEGQTNVSLETKSIDKILTTAQTVLGQLGQLNIITKHENELAAEIVNKGLELAKITDFTIVANDFADVNWKQSSNKLVEIIDIVKELAKANDVTTIKTFNNYISDVKEDIKLAITDTNVEYAADILAVLAEAESFKALLPKLVEYGIDKAVAAGYDISFLENIQLTNDEIAQDLITLTYIIVDLVQADAIAIYKGEPVSNLNLDAIKDIPVHLSQLNVLAKYANDWMAFVVNFALDKANIGFEKRYVGSDFEVVTPEEWVNDGTLLGEALAEIVTALDELLPEGITIEGVKSFINEKKYEHAENLPNEAIYPLFAGLSKLTELSSLGVILPDFVEFGLDKIPAETLDVSFLDAKSIAENLPADLLVLADVVVNAKEFGAISLIKGAELLQFRLENVNNIIDSLEELTLFTNYRANWWTIIIQKLYTALGITTPVTPQLFGEMTEDMWKADNDQLQVIVSSLETILVEENYLNSTINVKKFFNDAMYKDETFLYETLLTDANIDALANTIHELFKLNIIDSIDTELINYGMDKLTEKAGGLDIAFIGDAITKEVISHDILNIAEIAKAAKQFGVIELIRTKDIAKVEVNKLAPIFDELNEMLLLKSQRNSWMALLGNALSKFALEGKVSYKSTEFGVISDADCDAAIVSVKAILNNIDQILNAWQLEGLNEIKDFIAQKGFLTVGNLTPEVAKLATDLVCHVVEITPLQPLLPKLAMYGIDKLPKDVDLTFVKQYIENGTLTGAVIAQDVTTLMSIADDAIDFGAIAIYFKDYDANEFVIDYSYITSIVDKLETLSLLAVDYSSWLAFTANTVMKALKVEKDFVAADFAHMNDTLWHKDFANLKDIINQVETIAHNNNIDTIADVTNFINNKGYASAQFVNNQNVNDALTLVDTVFNGVSAQPIYLALADYAVDKFVVGKVEGLEFIKNVINSENYNAEVLVSDVHVITNIAREAVKFGAVELFYDKTMGDVELEYAINAIKLLKEVQLIKLAKPEWAAYIINTALSAANISGSVEASEFASMTSADWNKDLDSTVAILNMVQTLLETNNIETYEDITSFISEKKYQLAQYATDENVKALAEIVSIVSTMKILVPALDDVALYGVEKVNGIDLSFLANAIKSEELTNVELASDLGVVAQIVTKLVDFGALEYYFYRSIDEIHFDELAGAIELLDKLNVYTVNKENWLVLGVNELMKAIKVEDRFTASDFAGINVDDEVDHLVNILYHADDLLGALNIVSTDDLNRFIENKDYLNGQYLTNEVLDIVVLILDEVAAMGTTKLVLPAVAKWAVGTIKGDDLAFLRDAFDADMFSSDELISDLNTVIDIARILIDLGISDLAFNIPVESIDGQLVADVVAELENLNVFTKLRPNWVALGVNKALEKLNISVNVYELEAFTEAQWLEDNQYLQKAVIALCNAMNELEINSLSAINTFVKEGYLETSTYADNLLPIYNEILTNIISTNTAGLIFDDLLDYVITKAAEKDFDIEFIRTYTSQSFINDIPTVLEIVKSLVAFGALEYIKDKEISNIDVNHLANVVAELENLELFTNYRPQWAALLITKIAGTKIDVNVVASELDLTESEWLEDNATIQALVLKLGEILDNNNLNKYSEVVTFFKDDKKHTLEETYTDSNLALIADALQQVLSLNTVEVIFPQLVDIAVEAAKSVKLDLSFLSASITMNNVKNDVDVIINKMFKPLVKFGLFDLINNKELKFLNVEYLNPVFTEFENLEMYNISPSNWAASIVNCIAYHANLGFTVLPSDFDSVIWSQETDLFTKAVTAVDQFLVETDLVLISNITALINNKFAPQEQFTSNYYAELLLRAVESLVELQTVNAISDLLVDTLLDKLAQSNIDLTFLVEGVSNDEIVADIHTMVAAARDLLDFNIVDILYKNAAIDYSNIDLVYSALEKLFSLNMVEGKDTELVATILDKAGIDTTELRNGSIELDDELVTIKEVLNAAVTLFVNYNLNTIEDFKTFKLNVKLDAYTNENLDALSEILFSLSQDELFALTYKGISQKLVGDKLTGLADIHNIYADASLLQEDFRALSIVLSNVSSLDINGFVNEYEDYPINKPLFIHRIIEKLFNLHYFNLPGRMQNFLDGIEAATNFDLGDIDGNNIKLADDADKIIEMYNYLEDVFGQESFPIKNKHDIENKVKVPLSFFFEKTNFNNEIKAIESYMGTTIYDETGALILVLLVPVLKNALPEYWAVLDIDNYDADKIASDVPHYKAILETIMSMDPIAMRDGSVDLNTLDSSITDIIEALGSLELLNNKGNALAELLLKDLVYDKKLGNYQIASGSFNVADVNFDDDATELITLIDQILELSILQGVNNLNQYKDYFKDFKLETLLKDQASVEKLAEIIETLTQIDLVEYNIKAIYDIFAVPELVKANIIEYVDYRNSNNEELVEELNYLADAAVLLAEMGLGDILNGADINYDQADKVEQLLTIVGNMNYAKYHVNTYIEKYELTFQGLLNYGASYDVLDIPGDLALISAAYAELVPMLTDSNFAIKNIEDFKAIVKSQFLNNVKDHIDEIVNAYVYISQTSIAPYFYPTLVEEAQKLVPAQLKDIASIFTVDELTFEQVKSDMLVSGRLVKDLVDANIHEYLIDYTGAIPTQDVIEALINDVFDMYIFNTKFSAVLEKVMNKLNISTEGVDFDAIDWVGDKDLFIAELDSINELVDTLNINTINDVLALRPKLTNMTSLKEFIRDNFNSVNSKLALDIANNLLDTTVAQEIGLNVAKKVAGKVNLTGKLAVFNEILKLEKYDKASFIQEAKDGIVLLETLVDSKLYKNILDRNLAIDWENPYIETMIRQFVELQLLPLYGQEIVEGLGSIINKDLSEFNNSNVDWANEQDAYINAYNELKVMLSNNAFAFKSINDFLSLVKGTSGVKWTYFTGYNYAHNILDAFNELAGTGLANEGYKVVMSKLAKSSLPAAEYLDVTRQTREEQDQDYATFIALAKSAVDFIYNDGHFERLGIDCSLENVRAAQEMVDHVMNLNLFKGLYSDVVLAFMLKYNMDTVEVNLSFVDYEYEAELVKQAIAEILPALNEYGITTVKGLYSKLADLYATLRASEKDFLRDVKDALIAIDVEHIVKTVEIADESELFAQIALPVYNKFVAKFVPANYQSYLTIEDYKNIYVGEDIHNFAIGLRKLYDSEAYKVYTSNRVLNASEIVLAQEAVVAFGQLKVLEAKKTDIFKLIDRFVSQIDLSNLDVNSVVIADEAQVVADMLPALHTLYIETNRLYFTISMMGDQKITDAIINLYELALTSNVIRAAIPSLFRNVVISRVQSALGTNRYDDVTDNQIMDLFDDGVDALYALREMGVFSNNGIDLTDKALTDRVFAVIKNNINLGKYDKYLTKLMNNVAEFGVLPVDYSVVIPTKAEVNTLKEIAKEAMNFYKTYASSIKSLDVKIAADSTFQADLTNLVNKALESQLVEQVFMNLVTGASRIVTKNHGKLEICGTMTSAEFVNIALPDIFNMISYAEELGVLGGSVDYKNTDAIINLMKLGVTSPVTKDFINDIVPVALRKALKINVTKAELDAAGINWNDEVTYFEAFLNGVKAELQNANLSDSNSLLEKDFLIAASTAGKELLPSKFLEVIIKPVLNKAVTKISKATNMFDFMSEALESDTYTNAQAMEDYEKLLNVIEVAATINVFDDLDLTVLSANIDVLLDNLFSMHAAKGHEASIMRNILDKCTFVDTSRVDLNVITDWDEEIADFTDAIKVLENSGLLVVNADISARIATMGETECATFLNALNKSEILRPLVANNAYNALVIVLTNFGLPAENVETAIIAKYDWLYGQAQFDAVIDSEAKYNEEITKIVGYIANPSSLLV